MLVMTCVNMSWMKMAAGMPVAMAAAIAKYPVFFMSFSFGGGFVFTAIFATGMVRVAAIRVVHQASPLTALPALLSAEVINLILSAVIVQSVVEGHCSSFQVSVVGLSMLLIW
jgi:hypothetical protein